jgi:beta-glucosidase
VVLMGGSAIVVDPWHERVAAILHLWYPGMAGGHALADVLTGAGGVGPEGRLPFAVPVDEADLGPFDPDATAVTYDLWHGQGRLDRDGVAARYPLGFGLSYAPCVLERAEVEADGAGGVLRVRAVVRNPGERAGSEVVQVYARRRGSVVERPRRLVAFGRVAVAPGRAGGIELDVPVERLRARVDGEWAVEEGRYELVVGRSAADPQSVLVEVEIG